MADNITEMIAKDFERLQVNSLESENIRNKIIAKLSETLMRLELDPDHDKPTVTEAKLSIINTLNNVLVEHERQIRENIKVKQKQKEDESDQKIAQDIVALLSNINITSADDIAKITSSVDNLENKIKERGIKIEKEELERHDQKIKIDGNV